VGRPSVRNTVDSASDKNIILNHSIFTYNSLHASWKLHSGSNVTASYSFVSCRANAEQPSGNLAAAAPPSNAQVRSLPTHPTPPSTTPCAHLGPAFPSCSLAFASLPSPACLQTCGRAPCPCRLGRQAAGPAPAAAGPGGQLPCRRPARPGSSRAERGLLTLQCYREVIMI
jgi:hypothetical protein